MTKELPLQLQKTCLFLCFSASLSQTHTNKNANSLSTYFVLGTRLNILLILSHSVFTTTHVMRKLKLRDIRFLQDHRLPHIRVKSHTEAVWLQNPLMCLSLMLCRWPPLHLFPLTLSEGIFQTLHIPELMKSPYQLGLVGIITPFHNKWSGEGD